MLQSSLDRPVRLSQVIDATKCPILLFAGWRCFHLSIQSMASDDDCLSWVCGQHFSPLECSSLLMQSAVEHRSPLTCLTNSPAVKLSHNVRLSCYAAGCKKSVEKFGGTIALKNIWPCPSGISPMGMDADSAIHQPASCHQSLLGRVSHTMRFGSAATVVFASILAKCCVVLF